MHLKTLMDEFATRNKLVIGWCGVESLSESRTRMENRVTPFVCASIDKRTNPALIMKGVKSIIVIGTGHVAPTEPPDTSSGWLSSLGVNEDYHVTVKQKLHELIALLQTHAVFRYKCLVDSGTLDERALAVRAGLGFYGRNGMVVSPVFGPFFHIGLLLTDIPLDCSVHMEHLTQKACPAGCRICADACPGRAIPAGGYAINTASCVSYLTQKSGLLTEQEMMQMGWHLYGCDICRLVCPLPRAVTDTKEDAAHTAACVSPEEWLMMSDTDFNECYAHTAMMWRGANILRRNALVVLGNGKHDKAAAIRLVPLVHHYLTHPDEGVATAARYAYTRIISNEV